MFDKKGKVVFKSRVCRKRIRIALRQMSRSGPHCAVCDKSFKNTIYFEEHLRTLEHKMMDSPLQLILERVGESENRESPSEYGTLRLQANLREIDQQRIGSEDIDISGLLIGADCISSVQIFFCEACKTFVPEDSHPDALRRHCLTPEHRRMSALS